MRRGEPAGELVRISSRSLKAIADEIGAIHEQLGDELSLAQGRHLAGMICWIDGQSEDADRLIGDALALAERLGAHHVIAAAEHTAGIVALGRGEPATARRRFERSGRELAALSDVHHAFFPALTLGFPLERDERGRPRVTFQETMVLGQRLGAAQAAAFLHASVAWACRAEGDFDAAVALAKESARRAATLGWKHGEALALGLLGNLHRARGEHDQARTRLERSLALRRELGDRRAIGFALGCLGLVAAAEGDLAGAHSSLRAALELFERTEDGPGTVGMLLNLGVVALGAGDHARARACSSRAASCSVNPGFRACAAGSRSSSQRSSARRATSVRLRLISPPHARSSKSSASATGSRTARRPSLRAAKRRLSRS